MRISGAYIKHTLEYVQKVKGKDGAKKIAEVKEYNPFREYPIEEFQEILNKISSAYDNNILIRAGAYVYKNIKNNFQPIHFGSLRKINDLKSFLEIENKRLNNSAHIELAYTVKEDNLELKIKNLETKEIFDDFFYGYFKGFFEHVEGILNMEINLERINIYNYKAYLERIEF